jgi:hypothetical protein
MSEHEEYPVDPAAEPVVGPAPARPRTWVLVKDGVVTHVRHSFDWFKHPFGADHGGRVVDGTGVEVAPGYLVDAKGNFTPAEGRVAPIPEALPAYHAGPGVRAASPQEVAAALAGNAATPVDGEQHIEPELAQDGEMLTVEPRNKDVAEHDSADEPVHTTDVAESEPHDDLQPRDSPKEA